MPDNWWNQPVSTNVLLMQGTIVNADSTIEGDVWIKDGKIKKIARAIEPQDEMLQIGIKGMMVMPGGIDPNTRLEYEFRGRRTIDDFYYGTRAAVAGGTTTILDLIGPDIGESFEDAFTRRKKRADMEVVCDYGFHMLINWWDEEVRKYMSQAVVGCGINSFMMYMSYAEDYMLNDSEIYEACFACRQLGAVPMIQPLNGLVAASNIKRLLDNGIGGTEGHYIAYPESLEAEATNRACIIADQVKSPIYLCNIMSKSAAKVIKEKKREGYDIYGETLAAAVGTNSPGSEATYRFRAAFITVPPISHDPSTSPKLLSHLADGVLSTTASNNCTYTNEQKARGKNDFSKIPHGVNGIEDRMSIVWEKGVNKGILTPQQFVAVTSTNAAKIFNLYPKKGLIAEGADADVVVWNPDRFKMISHHNHRQSTDSNIFHGTKIFGGPEYVFVRGKMCVDGDVLRVKKGFGNYQHCPCFSKLLYPNATSKLLQKDDFEKLEF